MREYHTLEAINSEYFESALQEYMNDWAYDPRIEHINTILFSTEHYTGVQYVAVLSKSLKKITRSNSGPSA